MPYPIHANEPNTVSKAVLKFSSMPDEGRFAAQKGRSRTTARHGHCQGYYNVQTDNEASRGWTDGCMQRRDASLEVGHSATG